MDLANVFASDAFSMIALTDKVNKMPYVPGRAGRLGIFETSGITTTSLAIEEYAGTLSLIPNTARGGPSNQNLHAKRVLRQLTVPHLPLDDAIMAAEVQGIRGFGTTDLQAVESVVAQRLLEMKSKHDATLEYGRIGAIKGTILDADGSTVIYNLFTEFGVSQTSVDFALGTTTTNVKAKCLTVVRAIETELGADVYNHVHCFCGKTWFDEFVAHPEVKTAYERWQANGQLGAFLRDDNRSGFEFAGIIFEEYRGSVGGVSFVADSEAHFFPVGVPQLFSTRFAPADFMETVNTPGLPVYVKTKPKDYNKGLDIHTQSNPISFCKRPKVLVKGTTSN